MDCTNQYFSNIIDDARYANDPRRNKLPLFESLKLCVERTMPYWDCNIVKDVRLYCQSSLNQSTLSIIKIGY